MKTKTRSEPEVKSDGWKVVAFTETFLTLGGSFLGLPFILLAWQKRLFDRLYELQPDGRRRYRTFLIGVPRKNGKSQMAAAIGLYMLLVDDKDPAPLIVTAAGDRIQARMIFDEAKRMIEMSPELSDLCKVYRDEIRCPSRRGVYKVVSADAPRVHGLNPSTVLIDEYHVHKKDDLYVALTTGSATRNEPLILVISTAGHTKDSPLGEMYEYGLKVESGEIDDPAFGMEWHGPADNEEFDPSDPAVWEHYNPSWEIMNPDEFLASYKQTRESEFIRYRLNGWTATASAWFPAGMFERCSDETIEFEPGDRIVLGFDGAWKGDSTGIVGTRLSDLHQKVLGLWEAPPGGDQFWRTPQGEVDKKLRELCGTYDVLEIAADPYRFEQTLQTLADDGLPVVEYPTNSLARIVPGTQLFYEYVLDESLTHDGNPAYARHVGNAHVKEDAKGSRIVKEHPQSKKHIDLAVCGIISLQRALAWRDELTHESQIIIIG